MKQPKKETFPDFFYKEVYDRINEKISNFDYGEDVNQMQDYDFDLGEYWVHVECWFSSEWYDESFDHAFGTWHDPNAGWVITGIEEIGEIKVEDEDGNEVEGFDVEKFCKDFHIGN